MKKFTFIFSILSIIGITGCGTQAIVVEKKPVTLNGKAKIMYTVDFDSNSKLIDDDKDLESALGYITLIGDLVKPLKDENILADKQVQYIMNGLGFADGSYTASQVRDELEKYLSLAKSMRAAFDRNNSHLQMTFIQDDALNNIELNKPVNLSFSNIQGNFNDNNGVAFLQAAALLRAWSSKSSTSGICLK